MRGHDLGDLPALGCGPGRVEEVTEVGPVWTSAEVAQRGPVRVAVEAVERPLLGAEKLIQLPFRIP